MYILGKTLKIYIKTEFFCTWQKKKKKRTLLEATTGSVRKKNMLDLLYSFLVRINLKGKSIA